MDRKQISIRIRVDLLDILDKMQEHGKGECLNRSRTWLVENAVEKTSSPMVENIVPEAQR